VKLLTSATIYSFSLSLDSANNASITSSVSGTSTDITYTGADVYALDIDDDGYDEVALADWVDDRLYVKVLDVNNSGTIFSKYVKEIFSPSVARCLWLNVLGNSDNGESFMYTYADISLSGGDFVDEFAGDELVVGAQFSYTNGGVGDENETNKGLYLFPLRESLDGNNMPTMIIPDWCTQTYNPNFDSDYAFSSNYRPGLDMDAGDISGITEDELVLAYGTTIAAFNIVKGTDIGAGYFALKVGSQVFGSSTLNSDASVNSVDAEGPGFYADNFLSVGNIDPVLANDQNSYKEEIFFGANKYDDCNGCDEQRTEQSFTIQVIGLNSQKSIVNRGSLTNLFPLDEENDITPRKFSLALVDFDGGGLRLDNQVKNQNYTISLGLLPIIYCGDELSGGTLSNNERLGTIEGIINATATESFHVLPQETNTELSLYVAFNSAIVPLSKTVKIKHYRTKLGTKDKVLVTLDSFPIAAGGPSLLTNFFFEPKSGAKDDALVVTVETGMGDNFTSVIIPLLVTGVDYNVPILGTTITPQIPRLVLHDPPGDNSYSEFLEGKSFCRTVSQNITNAQGSNVEFNLKLGVIASVGFVVTTSYEVYTEFQVGMKMEITEGTAESYEECITTTKGFKTSERPDAGSIGENGDIFIGYGEELVYGVEKEFFIDSTTCTIDSSLTFAYASADATNFVLSTIDIENDIIAQQQVIDNIASTSADSARAQNQIDVWTETLNRNTSNIASATKLDQITFSGGGTTLSSSTEVETTETSSITYDIVIEKSAGIETLVNIGGTGFSSGAEFTITQSRGVGKEEITTNTKMIAYSLNDDDSGDVFNVDVFRDREYGTPLFKLANTSKTSCPYEGGIKRDQPKVSASSKQCSFEQNSKNIFVDNVDPDGSAVFTLNVCNEAAEERTYLLELTNNRNGAKASLASTQLNNVNNLIEFEVASGSCKTSTLTIERNPGLPKYGEEDYEPSYDVYDDLTFLLYPACGDNPIEDEADMTKISVTFGRSGGYPLGDEDCDGVLNKDDPDSCSDTIILDATSGTLDGTYNANNQIIVQPNAVFGVGKNIILNAPEVMMENDNKIPSTTTLSITSTGCGD
jgi:hypothetical protein